jgi:hypothetical protein
LGRAGEKRRWSAGGEFGGGFGGHAVLVRAVGAFHGVEHQQDDGPMSGMRPSRRNQPDLSVSCRRRIATAIDGTIMASAYSNSRITKMPEICIRIANAMYTMMFARTNHQNSARPARPSNLA